MSKVKKQYSPQFKAKVALEAIAGAKTTSELSSEYSIHPSILNKWKKKLIEEAQSIFDNEHRDKQAQENHQTKIDELYRQIGKLKVEKDFLADRSARLGLLTEKPW